MKSLIEEKTIQILNVKMILALIKETYGLDDYDIAFSESIEYPYGAYYQYHAQLPDPENAPKQIGKYTPFWCILDDLVQKGKLPTGHYYIWIQGRKEAV